MKKFLVILAILLLVLLAAGFWLVSNANSLIAGYKPELEKLLSSTLKAKVSLGEIKAQAFPELRFEAQDFKLEAQEGTSAEGVSLGKLVFWVKLMPLLSGELSATKVALEKPKLAIIKNAAGVSISGLPSQSQGSGARPAAAGINPGKQGTTTATGLPSWLKLNLEQFSLVDGEFSLQDHSQNKNYVVDKVNLDAGLNIAGSKLDIPSAKLSARALSDFDLSLDANNIAFDLDKKLLQIGQTTLNSDFGSIALQGNYALNSKAAEFSAKLNDLHFKKDTLDLKDGSGNITISSSAAAQNFSTDNLQASLNGEKLDIKFKGSLVQDEFKLADIKLLGFGGEANAKLDFNLKSQAFACNLSAATLALQRLLQALKPGPVPVTGTLQRISVDLSGQNGPSFKESLNGKLGLTLKDAELIGFNLAGSVLKTVKDIPLVSGALFSRVPPEFVDEVSSEKTPVRELSADFNLANAKLNTKNLKLLSTIFSLDGAGQIGLDSSLDLNSTIYFSAPFSQALTHSVKELSAILDQEKRLVLPLKISGQAPQIVVVPDTGKLLKRGAENLIRDKAGDLLNKALGGGGDKKGLGGLLGF